MKRYLFIFIAAGLLMSCVNGRRQQSTGIEKRWSRLDTVSHDSTPQVASQKDAAENPPKDKTANIVNSSTKRSLKGSTKASDNMRGFDPASEDDMDDNGMSRYFDNNDEEGWD